MKRRTKFGALIVTAALAAAALTACEAEWETPNSKVGWSGTLSEETFTLKDGRTITCITLADKNVGGGGLDCDWNGATP